MWHFISSHISLNYEEQSLKSESWRNNANVTFERKIIFLLL